MHRIYYYIYHQIWWFPQSLAKDCLPTGQEQACTRITRLFGWLFVTMPKMAEYTEKQLLTPPSTPQFSLLQPTTAQFSLVKTSTVQYSPVQPSTAQCSPLQPTTTSAGESIPPCIHLYTVQTVFCTEAPWSCAWLAPTMSWLRILCSPVSI